MKSSAMCFLFAFVLSFVGAGLYENGHHVFCGVVWFWAVLYGLAAVLGREDNGKKDDKD